MGYLLLSAALFSEAAYPTGPKLIAVFRASRAMSAWPMTRLPSARPQGMLDAFAQTAQRRMVGLASLGYLILCVLLWGFPMAIAALSSILLCYLFYRHMALKHFGGVTGDLAGWFSQTTELVLTAVIVLGGKF